MEEELFDVVDKNDNVLQVGLKENELQINNDITRVVSLYLYDKNGKINISQRVASKKVDPLKFEASAHGRVKSGEKYDKAIKREVQEELNVNLKGLIEIDHYYSEFDTNVGIRRHFRKLFIGFTDEDISFNKNEIKGIKSFESFEELKSYYLENKEIFSTAIEIGMSKLTNFFSNSKNKKLVKKQLSLIVKNQ